MTVREHVSLATLTTFRTGGTARYVATCESLSDVQEAIIFAFDKDIPWYVLGSGSNVLAPDEGYAGLVILMQISGITFEDAGDTVLVTVGAGESWDEFVQRVGEENLWGLENLAGIPGTVGAAPVQNIGAYGADIGDTLTYVEVLDTRTGDVSRLTKEACELSYRDSRFKRESNLVILRVTCTLSKEGVLRGSYGDVQRAVESGVDMKTPRAIGEAIRRIRGEKFPDLSVYGTAGSFFKNPILSEKGYEHLVSRFGEVPQFPHPHGIKIPLAFILDRVLNLREFRMGHAWLFGKQPLVLTLDAGGTTQEVHALAEEVAKRVYAETEIKIEREVRTMPMK